MQNPTISTDVFVIEWFSLSFRLLPDKITHANDRDSFIFGDDNCL